MLHNSSVLPTFSCSYFVPSRLLLPMFSCLEPCYLVARSLNAVPLSHVWVNLQNFFEFGMILMPLFRRLQHFKEFRLGNYIAKNCGIIYLFVVSSERWQYWMSDAQWPRNWKGCGKSYRGVIWCAVPTFPRRDWRMTRHVSRWGPTDIQTRHLPNTSGYQLAP